MICNHLASKRNMKCPFYRSSRFVISVRSLSIAFTILASCGCEEKTDVTVVGEVREPGFDCEPTFVEYKYRVKKPDAVPLGTGADWCAVMGDGNFTCFLNTNNERYYYYLTLPRNQDHTVAEPSHPDLACWKEELGEWGETYGGYSAGGAGSSPDEDDPYHPVFNNGD